MRRYVVAFINFYDNILKIEFVRAENEVDAAKTFLLLNCTPEWSENQKMWVKQLGSTLETIKKECFDVETMIEVREVEDRLVTTAK